MTTTYQPREFVTYTESSPEFLPSDLRSEYDEIIAEGEAVELYSAVPLDRNGYLEPLGTMTMLYLPERGRVGICTNATSDWADYDDVERAFSDYLNDPDTFTSRN